MKKVPGKQRVISSRSWFIYGATLLLIVIFSNIHFLSLGYFDEKRVVEAVLLIAAGILLNVLYFRYEVRLLTHQMLFAGSLLLLLLIVSSFFAPLKGWAFLEVGWYVLIGQASLLFAVLYQLDSVRYIQWFISGLLVLSLLYLIQVFADLITTYTQLYHPIWPDLPGYIARLNGVVVIKQGFLNFSNVRFFNHLQTWSLPLLVFSVLYYKDRLIPGLRYLLLSIAVGWWMLVFASDARGVMVASVVSLMVVGYLHRSRAKEFIITYVGVAAVSLVVYLLIFILPDQGTGEILTRTSSSGRYEVWIYTLKLIAAHPFLGLGPMHFSYTGVATTLPTPHNFILQSAVEWGIPATLLCIGLAIAGYVKFSSLKAGAGSGKDPLIHVALVTSLTAGITHSMVSGIFNTPFSQLMFCVILGWAIGYYFENSDTVLLQKRKNINWHTWLIGFLIATNTIFVAQKVARDIPTLNERKEHFLEVAKNDEHLRYGFYTRFWQQGKIGLEGKD